MASEMVEQVLKAESCAKQSEQKAISQATIIHGQAQQQAQEIIAQVVSAANMQAKNILQEAENKAQEMLAQSQQVLETESDKLRTTVQSRWSKAVENAISTIIPQ